MSAEELYRGFSSEFLREMASNSTRIVEELKLKQFREEKRLGVILKILQERKRPDPKDEPPEERNSFSLDRTPMR